MGISFEYPASWHMERAASAEYARTVQYTFIRPGGNFTAAFQSGDNAALKHSPATLEAWRDQYLEMLPNATYRTDYRLVASEPATLSGSPAWRIEYTALMKNGPRMRGEVFLMMNGTRGAMIALVGNDDADGALSDGPRISSGQSKSRDNTGRNGLFLEESSFPKNTRKTPGPHLPQRQIPVPFQ
ncbi:MULTISPECIES: hypothetical protein [unclassified Methanoregula]|uniref:hypothetical protein n=1 Tax=unclassified Methanoregula TaxID=2649730 RepID=UPI0009CACBB9|nr:MAG: hypothetical protein A4E33_01794 [Methanoregula sp. PtaB.Bin085]OPY36332.1 MAG: hypothetical protein A4E34_00297 [Methanoregula sp. PtaU1.Bin006]